MKSKTKQVVVGAVIVVLLAIVLYVNFAPSGQAITNQDAANAEAATQAAEEIQKANPAPPPDIIPHEPPTGQKGTK